MKGVAASNPDDHAKHGEERAHLVLAQHLHGDDDGLGEVHGVWLVGWRLLGFGITVLRYCGFTVLRPEKRIWLQINCELLWLDHSGRNTATPQYRNTRMNKPPHGRHAPAGRGLREKRRSEGRSPRRTTYARRRKRHRFSAERAFGLFRLRIGDCGLRIDLDSGL